MYRLMQETDIPAQDESESDDLASLLAQKFGERERVSLREVVSILTMDDEWCDWWNYHQNAWEVAGWKMEHEMHVEDFPLLFSHHASLPKAADYQFRINAPVLNRNKIDDTGEYKWFPCLSVIADMSSFNTSLCEELYMRLLDCPLIAKYYRLLPVDTWHMTIVSLYVPETLPCSSQIWQQQLEKQLDSKKIQAVLEQVKDDKLTIQVSNCHALGILLLQVEVDGASRDKIQFRESHVSLAYQYRSASLTTMQAIEEKWKPIIEELFSGKELMPGKPKLACFESMNKLHDSPISCGVEEELACVSLSSL